jgi:hypothetical protein
LHDGAEVAVTDDAFKQAHDAGYRKGYAAGKRRADKETTREQFQQQQQEFLERAFLAALPQCVSVGGWKRGDKPITNLEDRVDLAWDFAEMALKKKRYAP